MLLIFVLAGFIVGILAAASPYLPLSWTKICQENVSVSSLHPTRSPASPPTILVDLRCIIPKSEHVHWKLNDLRDWTIHNKINQNTTPSNRTVIYNISVTCANGANISLPWPMRVAGLVEIHVFYCSLVDIYKNTHDKTDSTISNDLKVSEIRHSTRVLNQTNELRDSDGAINITSLFDCGQDSSLETSIASNISYVMRNLDWANVDLTNLSNSDLADFVRVSTKQPSNFGDIFSSIWPAKPEDRLIKDTHTVISDPTDLDTKSDRDKKKTLEVHSSPETALTKAKEAELEHLRFLVKVLNAETKCNYQKLKVLDESMAPLTSQHHFEFMIQGAEYPVLEIMNYSYSGLLELPKQLAQWRIYFPKLKHLDVSHNYISEVKLPAYPSRLKNDFVTFDMRHNNITFISMDILKSWAAVEKFFVDIRDNPIHCGCDISTFLPYLENNSTFTDSLAPYTYVRQLYCHTPEALAGKQLHQLTADSLLCPVYGSNKTPVIVLGIIMAFLIIIIILIIRFKVEIRILLYTRLHVRLPCDADEQRNNKTFDAFVSYSNEDYDWVHENLVKFLEKSPTDNPAIGSSACNNSTSTKGNSSHVSFKLCVHQRDFIPGKTIFDNIVDSIEASRHTIIVLSPSFMRSHWAMEELRQAYRQSLVEKTRHLIVILLEKVPKDEMDPLISRCCKTFTYLEVDDSLFKDRLVFSLTTKDRSAKRRDRLAAKEEKSSQAASHMEDSSIYDTVDDSVVYENEAYFPSTGRPKEPARELSNMSTSSTTALTPC